MKKTLATIILTLIIGLQLIPIASAVYGIPELPGKTKELPFEKELKDAETVLNKYKMGDVAAAAGINLIIRKVADGILYIAAPVVIIFIAYAGMSYIMAMGKQEGLDAAKKSLTWGILGLLLIIMSYGIVRLLIAMLTSFKTPPVT